MSTIVGNICYSGSVGLPHSAGRAHLVWGTIIYSYDDGKGRARCGLVGPFAKVTQYNKLFNTFIVSLSFSFLMYASFHLHSASGQGGVSQPAGGSQVWDESSHQPQAQRDFYTGGVQQHQPSGVAVGVRQSQPTAHLTAWHEGMEDTVFLYMVLKILDSIIHKYVGTYTLTQIGKMDIHSPYHICAKAHAWVNIGQAFLLQYTNSILPKGVCGSYTKLIHWSQRWLSLSPSFSYSIAFSPLPFGFNHCHFTLSSAMPPSQPFALLMDSLAAKDLGCLLGGYYKLLVDPSVSVFRLGRPKVRVHRIPAEEGVCGRFAVIEGVCYESLSSEQKLFHLKWSLSSFGYLIDIFHITSWCHQPVWIRIEKTVMFYHHNINFIPFW